MEPPKLQAVAVTRRAGVRPSPPLPPGSECGDEERNTATIPAAFLDAAERGAGASLILIGSGERF